MKKRDIFRGVLCAAGCLLTLSCVSEKEKTSYIEIPKALSMNVKGGNPFVLTEETEIVIPSELKDWQAGISVFNSSLRKLTGDTLAVVGSSSSASAVLLKHNPELPSEGFRLHVNADEVRIEAADAAGAFYALQVLNQSLLLQKQAPFTLPAVDIEDGPEMKYRGAMLDVSRHFFTVEQVKRFIDLLAVHRLNYFHWHLTDDQGWRMEVKKYPKLTEVSKEFYTQEEIKDVISYAKQRFITVVPEIDLPGHTTAALVAYPQLGCTGGPYTMTTDKGGVHKDVLCMGKDFSYQFAKDVLAEVATLFPSPYIHIGGDEVPRDRWKQCPDCQAAIKKYHLKATQEQSAEDLLQGEFNVQMAAYLKTLGKQMVGWDEVLSDNIDPSTIIMSWRGLNQGFKALKKGHPVIFSSTGHFYFNNCQAEDAANEPLSTGGLLPMQTVYEAPLVLPENVAGRDTLVLGAEACLWTSHVDNDQLLDYMMLPRLAAFSEVTWTGSCRGGYADFLNRLPHMLEIYEKMGFGYAPHFFGIKASYAPDAEKNQLFVTLNSVEGSTIYYTLDGTVPDKNSQVYQSPIGIEESCTLKAVAYTPSGLCSDLLQKEVKVNKGTFKKITLQTTPETRYAGEGGKVLVDGVRSQPFHTTGMWVGYLGKPMEAVIDMEEKQNVTQVVLSSLTDMGSYIMGISKVEIYASDNGKDFTLLTENTYKAPEAKMQGKKIENLTLNFSETQARFIKVVARGFEALPEGHSGAGQPPFLFVDEIEIN